MRLAEKTGWLDERERELAQHLRTKMQAGDATEILVVDRVLQYHVLRAGTVCEQGRDNRTAHLLHLVALRRLVQRGHRGSPSRILTKI